ncbi:MAG: phosphoribosyl transferase [Patescibacteria group bacterium]|nr:phosphoribosyl transferase [Patescibacteria group bacterium]
MYQNRSEAGKQLSKRLIKYKNNKEAIVLALPRGGVVLGYEIAEALNLPLDIVVVRKIGHPSNPEYAICVVNENGSLLCDEPEYKYIDQNWLKKEILKQKVEAQRRINLYRGERKPVEITGKVVIIVDDGIATGLSMQLAIRSVKIQSPKRIIVAVPVAPSDSKSFIHEEGADEIITLEPFEEYMGSVGSHYLNFEQIQDDKVVQLLKLSYEKYKDLV